MIDSKILESEWIEPKKTGWGHQLKKDAPDEVKKEFEQYLKAMKEHRG